MTYTIQRAIVKGNIAGVVETRNMFTAQVEVVSPDTYQSVWHEYLDDVYSPVLSIMSGYWGTYSMEIQHWFAGHWEPLDEVAYSVVGSGATENLANLVAFVLIGKAIGRRRMGRKFFSPLVEGAVDGNSLIASALVAAGLALTAYITPLTTANDSHLAPGILDKAGNFQGFATGFVSSLLGTIRRRKPNIGV